MSFNRRQFLHKTGMASPLLLHLPFSASMEQEPRKSYSKSGMLSPDQLPSDEDFWYYIQQSFTVSPSIINLNNGGVSPAPKTVQDAMKRFYDISNEAPSYYMWRVLDMGREPLRTNLAKIAGCNAEEIAMNRNSSEGLETSHFWIAIERGR